jgi:endonuclease/exonuclease/phosphatase family metal-dependent hydrolase
MWMNLPFNALLLGFFASIFVSRAACGAELFRVATYNVNNYLNEPSEGRAAKLEQSKTQIRKNIRALNADVVALQEVGTPQDLLELRQSLQNDGANYPHWEWVPGADPVIHVAVLSRFSITARRPHTNESFLLYGRRMQVSRGFAELDFRVNDRYLFTLMTAHLKSRRVSARADESELREQEALLLRGHIEAFLTNNPSANLIVLGDFNDTKDSAGVRAIRGHGKFGLVDTRPSERNGDSVFTFTPRSDPMTVTWTHYFAKEDTYSRIDYIMLSPGMAREWVPNEGFVLATPNWGLASDHRPIVAAFWAENR